MKEFKYVVQDELGLHARPAGLLVKEAAKYKSAVTLDSGAKKADAKRIMAVMSMGVKKGVELTVTIDGEDEDVAAEAIENFFKENL
ncbi:MAG: HPr family phosphocarrier protein [Lachnospiraceae bacterium]|jgi:phosphocarrier protein HPr|nr:HPr family phosphocarrier protein [Lachnospiraceae bacterium]NBK91775.1 HPr family phosphocarrier protein [bacterium 1XD21-13]